MEDIEVVLEQRPRRPRISFMFFHISLGSGPWPRGAQGGRRPPIKILPPLEIFWEALR